MIIEIRNGKIISDNKITIGKNLYIENEKILCVTNETKKADIVIDAKGNYVSPGFIDLHCHGGGGYEFVDSTKKTLINACEIHLKNGTTTLYPTVSAYDFHETDKALENIEKYKKFTSVNILGAHLEGPYFSKKQAGAQLSEFIKNPDKKEYEMLYEKHKNIIKRWSYAPELCGVGEFLEFLNKNNIIASMGHTDAEYSDIKTAYQNGCRLVTHLYSCTSSIKRKDGFRILGVNECAYLFDDMYVEAIADGCHLPVELLQLIYKLKGSDKICLVTDSIRFGGLDKIENTDKYPYFIEDGVAKLNDRSGFAGSIATTNMLLRICKKADIPIESAVKMITEVPAKIMGLNTKGSIKENYDGDVVIFDNNVNIKKVIVNGKIIY